MGNKHGASRSQAVELGTIDYVNLSPNQKHGDMAIALEIAAETKKPIFANFVECNIIYHC